jgi:hypothetical protein
VFNRIVERSVRTKAKKGQAAHGSGVLRGMIVDLSRSQIADDMRHPAHRPSFEQIVKDIDIKALGLDLIAFCGRAPYERRKQRRGLFADFIAYEETAISAAEIDQLLNSD